jgi:hypothetical protein
MLKTRVTKISWWNSFSFEILILKYCTSYIIEKLLPLKVAQFMNAPLESINFTLFSMCICHNSLMVPKNLISGRVPYHFLWSFWFNHDNFSGWFSIGRPISNLIFLVMSSNLFCSPLWKVVASSMLIFGSSSLSKLPTCPTPTLSYKTCSNFFSYFYQHCFIL